ncbi:dTDP-4-dehydrorhamnose 3,5-epimerase [Pseudomonas cyclaminis]|uniref:dTDP-4-dehydrorhamnose 3,5-epimerase n=1 Tax=Pseudomonas cyclaminis TaxID=2781239 RepID=UPI00380B948C
MIATKLTIPEVIVLEPKVFGDARGFFFESFNSQVFEEITGLNLTFVQDNQSRSTQHVLRGLHYQIGKAQGKLVRVISGEIFDVAVDIRRSSSTFGQWVGVHLTADNKKQLWIPEGFAHGFITLSETAEVLYKTTEYYSQPDERCIAWDDKFLNIQWPCGGIPTLSMKDANGISFQDAEVFD